MARFLVGMVFLVLSAICLGAAARSLVEPLPPPVYTARGLADLVAHGEEIPPVVVLVTAGFSDEPTPAYYVRFPGEPAIVFTAPVAPLPKRVTVRVEGTKPIRVTLAASR